MIYSSNKASPTIFEAPEREAWIPPFQMLANTRQTFSQNELSYLVICVSFLIGPLAYFFFGLSYLASVVAMVSVLCVSLWTIASLPTIVVSLIPMAIYPLSGVLTAQEVAASVGNSHIMLLLGGFFISLAIEKSGLHLRYAVAVLRFMATSSPRIIIFSLMFSAAFVSLFVPNIVAILLFLPIARKLSHKQSSSFVTAMFLGVTFASAIGGMGTPLGTASNFVFLEISEKALGSVPSFTQWMYWCIPVVVSLILCIGFWLCRKLPEIVEFNIPTAPPWSLKESRTLKITMICLLLWTTSGFPFGGWSQFLTMTAAPNGIVALLGAISFFIVGDGKGKTSLLTGSDIKGIPWSILLIVAGGLTLSAAIIKSNIAGEIAKYFMFLEGLPVWAIVILICLAVSFLTELTNNVAATALLMPLLATVGAHLHLNPLVIMLPVMMSVSSGFILPMTSPVNALVFDEIKVSRRILIKEGLMTNLIAVLVISLSALFVIYGKL